VKLDLDERERRAVSISLADRKARLIELAQDTTQHPAARRAGMLELEAIKSVLRKLKSGIATSGSAGE
jgi:hypothetical protein